jgi:16S rRNA (uracil1498-N3)-methyltransferase
MPPRIHVDVPLLAGTDLTLPAAASRHVQVLRLQPGDAITLFDGRGGQWQAAVLAMGRKDVTARLLAHQPLERELHTPVTLALGMPANERMDALVEKATELGVATIAPLVCERSVLRLAGERAERRSAHWQAIAVAACEQSGRNRVPQVLPPQPLRDWLAGQPASLPVSLPPDGLRLVLSLADGTLPLRQRLAAHGGGPVSLLSGPEGGLSPAELAAAAAAGHLPTTLGARVLRADTAPLAALAVIAALESPA